MNDFISMIPTFMFIVSVLAFIVSIIITVIKTLPVIDKVPTDLIVVALAITLSVLSYFTYIAIMALTVTWYEVTGAVVGGFIVAFIAMFGWEKFHYLWSKYHPKDGGKQ